MSTQETLDEAVDQPSDLGALKVLVEEFIEKIKNVDNELELLKEQRKELFEEYSRKLDVKTLKAALQVIKIRDKVNHKHTFDEFVEILERIS